MKRIKEKNNEECLQWSKRKKNLTKHNDVEQSWNQEKVIPNEDVYKIWGCLVRSAISDNKYFMLIIILGLVRKQPHIHTFKKQFLVFQAKIVLIFLSGLSNLFLHLFYKIWQEVLGIKKEKIIFSR